MAGGGRRVGAGAPRGPRPATVKRRERALAEANIREQIDAADLAAAKLANAGRKLGKDVLEEFMFLFAGLAAQFQPLPAGMAIPPGRLPDEGKFEKWARLAVDTAAKLADFQSPKFKAIAVMAPAPSLPERPMKDAGNVIRIDDPVAVSRVYANRVRSVR